ncbi:relaxase/mobilization nuclease domain-containing protein [Gordonibacter urolithinfaciens]|uniref:relaxase/mobilization nuclease domain-containing protein n=1 Tax=Gordonibacter urolithinfaciens TaxID=1335613 RepID=UPI001391522A
MTIVSQKAVASAKHARKLKDYIEGKDALLRDCINVFEPHRAFEEMAETRRAAGHDRPSRRGAANTVMLHQVLAFLPEEADVNGGPLSPEDCMRYAREYASRRGYDAHQVVLALHEERCEEDGTSRYAVHLAINRTNLDTGKRLCEGRSAQAKRDRAATVRALDAEWGLRQVVEGAENSRIHKRQPHRAGAEGRILERAARRGRAPEEASYKYNLRKLCQGLARRSANLEEYRRLLGEWGVASEVRDGRIYVADMDNDARSFLLSRLDGTLAGDALEGTFGRAAENARLERLRSEVQAAERRAAEYQAAKEAYLKAARRSCKEALCRIGESEGSKLKDLPRLRLPRIPEALARDAEVNRAVLGMARRVEAARCEAASDLPPSPMRSPGGSGRQGSARRPGPAARPAPGRGPTGRAAR